MTVHYFVEMKTPESHMVSVKMTFTPSNDQTEVYLPSWSPGSYLMREYAKNIRTFSVLNQAGEYLYFEKKEKGIWLIDEARSDLKQKTTEITVEYTIYCHELTVRTSHVDESHAFLHGPSYLMGIKDQEEVSPTIEFRLPPTWQKLSTSLKDISKKRETFLYSANNYDDLIDTPVEMGNQSTDGFMVNKVEHHLAFYGQEYAHKNDLKKDIKTIVETVLKTTKDIPYDNYLFLTHFKANLYGGLEHKNSTALQFDGRKLNNRKDYLNWLGLVAHEYFHTWNVKRIRPQELGPFDYTSENYTRMHWLTEGLTSFMDELFVLRSGLCTLEEYLEMQKNNLKNYYSIPGKKFDSLEDSSFDAWIKLYRPDENSKNSSVSYYLKGGLVFSILNILLINEGSSIDEFIQELWKGHQVRPEQGLSKEEVLSVIESLSSSAVREEFETMISTTEDIDFEKHYSSIGLAFDWEQPKKSYLGIDANNQGSNLIIERVVLDGPAYQAGLNAKDEIIAINNQRVKASDKSSWSNWLLDNETYHFLVSRMGELVSIPVIPGAEPKTLKIIGVKDEGEVNKYLGL